MIKIEGLTKYYGDKMALNNLNLEIKDGEIFGLIGHNGAGKSTTIKSLVSIINPTSGKIFVDGMDLEENRMEVKKLIAYVSDTPDMFLRLPAISFWKFVANAYGVDPETRERRLNYLCSIFSMEGNYNEVLGNFSHGMRQKAFIIAALISNPKIWILDEPMTGLDPQASYNLKELMKQHVKDGNTVVFSTHVLEVAEQLCDRIAILSKGRLIFLGTIDELKSIHPGESLEKIYLNMVSPENSEFDYDSLDVEKYSKMDLNNENDIDCDIEGR
ncbi:ABC transporter ATP-binding protein [Peptostreptococcus russellii]|uniref:ABC-2 type transport system ATP-binding protein n=1 Tax=Peptostreptococcus russellii TaxID=215200 RepID=A0A1H8GT87_9FIRM|nr:ABC transporter ATP-binding protein [Peptostreptococcus russellii]MBC2578021.1 ABC transporter ATP-binding protein [Peptostreptococcus russellii]SEN47252.1 ABC-2 type transport system ATP-binding protein [Peptostreptococcus russellii]